MESILGLLKNYKILALTGLSGHHIHRYRKADFLFSEVELGEMMVYADMVEAVDPSLVATYTKTR